MGETLIELVDVGMRYKERDVLSHVDITINRGDFLAVTGPNGGGKTTFLRIILRLLKPTSGRVIYYADKSLRIGYLPQKNMIDSHFPITVRDVAALGLYGRREFASTVDDHIMKVLAEVGLEEYVSHPIGALSGGQLQRALLARAIVSAPDFLVLDEPLSYLDKRYEQRVYDIISRLSKDGTTIILVSHEMSTIASMANRHVIVDHNLHFCRSAHHFIHYDCCEHH